MQKRPVSLAASLIDIIEEVRGTTGDAEESRDVLMCMWSPRACFAEVGATAAISLTGCPSATSFLRGKINKETHSSRFWIVREGKREVPQDP